MTWVATGLSGDLPPATVMPGSWQGTELALWRSASGTLSAWKDRCPHRGMRLSHGFVRGEALSCIYHGWVYGSDGACRRIPAHPDLVPPSAIRAEVFAAREAGGVIWVAPADEAAPLPDLPPARAVRSMPVAADAAALAAAAPDLTPGPGRLSGRVMAGAVPLTLCLLLQQMASGDVVLHALCAPGDDPVLVSRWLEGLRRRAEERIAA